MFCRMLASMSEIDPRADAPLVGWSDLGVSGLLPTGTVTLLLADVEVGGDLAAARRCVDDAVSTTTEVYLTAALTTRARVAIAQGEPEHGARDAHDALARAAELEAYLYIPDILECLAALAGEAGSHREAARLFRAAQAIRQHIGMVRFKIHEAGYQASVTALRDALGEKDFDAAWAEGAALSTFPGQARIRPPEGGKGAARLTIQTRIAPVLFPLAAWRDPVEQRYGQVARPKSPAPVPAPWVPPPAVPASAVPASAVPASAVPASALPAAVPAGIRRHWRGGGGCLLNRCGFSHGCWRGRDGDRSGACSQNGNDLLISESH